jgi:hypothetical protein
MSDTRALRDAERDLLPNGFEWGRVFEFDVNGYRGIAEVDGFNPETGEAIEICLSETFESSPKPGQKRKLASDALKLIFLADLQFVSRGRIFVSSPELSRWFHEAGSWLSAACRHYGIALELKTIANKRKRKTVRNALLQARKEMPKHRGA